MIKAPLLFLAFFAITVPWPQHCDPESHGFTFKSQDENSVKILHNFDILLQTVDKIRTCFFPKKFSFHKSANFWSHICTWFPVLKKKVLQNNFL